MLLTTGLHPPRLDALPFSLAWLAAAAVLLLLMLLGVAPASASGAAAAGAAQQQQQPGAGGGAVAVLAVAAPVPPAPAAPSGSPLAPPTPRDGRSGAWRRSATALAGLSPSRVRQLLGARRPRRNAVLALLASLQCMLWLSIAADELVSLFQVTRVGPLTRLFDCLLVLWAAHVSGSRGQLWSEAARELPADPSPAAARRCRPSPCQRMPRVLANAALPNLLPPSAHAPSFPPLPRRPPPPPPSPPCSPQSIGRICDFSQDLLGATVLAWGEAVPELVATMTLARQGHATTAVSAVFGGARGWAGGAAAASVPAAACCASAALCVPAAAWQLCWHGSR
jgi:Ca2+/Na+ antiporter